MEENDSGNVYVPKKEYLRQVLLHYFFAKKNAAETHRLLVKIYGEQALSERSCREWFQRFKSGDYNVNDKKRTGAKKKFEDTDLLTLIAQHPSQTLKELAEILNVSLSTVSIRLHTIGLIQKNGNWVPQELTVKQQDQL